MAFFRACSAGRRGGSSSRQLRQDPDCAMPDLHAARLTARPERPRSGPRLYRACQGRVAQAVSLPALDPVVRPRRGGGPSSSSQQFGEAHSGTRHGGCSHWRKGRCRRTCSRRIGPPPWRRQSPCCPSRARTCLRGGPAGRAHEWGPATLRSGTQCTLGCGMRARAHGATWPRPGTVEPAHANMPPAFPRSPPFAVSLLWPPPMAATHRTCCG